MPSIHFVERLNNVKKLPDAPNEWESGYWFVSEETASKLTGGKLYLHSAQNAPSHFGGEILGYRVHQDSSRLDINGRIVFRIRATHEYKNIVTGRDGWGNEKKLVW